MQVPLIVCPLLLVYWFVVSGEMFDWICRLVDCFCLRNPQMIEVVSEEQRSSPLVAWHERLGWCPCLFLWLLHITMFAYLCKYAICLLGHLHLCSTFNAPDISCRSTFPSSQHVFTEPPVFLQSLNIESHVLPMFHTEHVLLNVCR